MLFFVWLRFVYRHQLVSSSYFFFLCSIHKILIFLFLFKTFFFLFFLNIRRFFLLLVMFTLSYMSQT